MLLTPEEIDLFKKGSLYTLFDKLGSHILPKGVSFAVWAPNALQVSVIGDFNHWDAGQNPLTQRNDGTGIWEGTIQTAAKGNKYKYRITTQDEKSTDRIDPYAFYCEQPPGNASIIWDLDYTWREDDWQKSREKLNNLNSPFLIYEMHLPSWKRTPEEDNRPLTYAELAVQLPEYIKKIGFTHVEFLPVMEHPLFGSWGYQTLGYFAPSSRYGTPQDFMKLIEALHNEGIGIILDWPPSHFPADSYGLASFDGTHLYEYQDPRKRTLPDWNTLVFDYSKPQVKSFMISNVFFWLEKYHVDGIRVDAVASMLYLDYGRKPGHWEPNIYGGRENLEAIDFLRTLNSAVYAKFPYAQTIAEESTEWPMVSRPVYVGGLGFGMKWNMGWMHDTLEYMSLDPINRKYHHNRLLFSLHYAFFENFILPFSHDEVVYGKRSLINKMPGDIWQKFANLRLLYGYMYSHPGKKLLFMGDEFGQWNEWYHEKSLDWHLTSSPFHAMLLKYVQDLNSFCKNHPAFYELDFSEQGFEWVDTHDWEQSIISFMRKSKKSKEIILAICNFTPVPRFNYRIGIPKEGYWKELFNSDAQYYGGSGIGNSGGMHSEGIPSHGKPHSLSLTLPPLAVLYFIFTDTAG